MLLLATLGGNASASTTWYVDGVHGNDANTCKSPTTACKTIGHAISLASSGDSIMVAAATHTENLTIRISLNVLGAGANATILDGGGKRTVVTIPNTSASVILSGITVFHGYAKFGGGVYNSGTLTITNTTISGNGATCAIASAFVPAGGGIYNLGTLMIYNGTISGNGASCHRPVGGVVYAFGGGILNSGTLTIKSSTINGNTTFAGNFFCFRSCNGGGMGGGVYNNGTLTITNSTLFSNSAKGYPYPRGGGINNESPGNVALNSSTLSGNSSDGYGGGLSASGTVTIQNSIVASNTGGNCSGSITSLGYNLSNDTICNFNRRGDLIKTDLKLGTLGNYGGPTQTIPLLAGSPAIDAGNPSGCRDSKGNLLTTDQLVCRVPTRRIK